MLEVRAKSLLAVSLLFRSWEGQEMKGRWEAGVEDGGWERPASVPGSHSWLREPSNSSRVLVCLSTE